MIGKNKAFQIISNITLALFTVICILPFVLLIASSFTDEKILTRFGYSFIPREIDFDAYRYILVESNYIVRGYGISFLVTFVGTLVSMIISTMFAYAISRKELPGRNIIAFFLFFTMLFNGGLVPSYIMWTSYFHIKNTIYALIVPNLLMGAYYVIMIRTYFTTNIPDEVIEAARIDGAGEFKILATIVIPMSVPIMATIALLIGLNYWNDWMNGLYYITDDHLYSIQVFLNKMLTNIQFLLSGSNASQNLVSSGDYIPPATSIRMAIAVMGVLPVLIIYPFFQKYIVSGITVGAVKG